MRVVKHWHKLPGDVVDGQCFILGSVQGQEEWGSEHPDLVENVPPYCRDFVLDDLLKSLPSQTILWFCDHLSPK